MRERSKDSSEVVEFMSLFARLKTFSDDGPDDLIALSEQDLSVKAVCLELGNVASFLRMNESRARRLFAAPVDPNFIAAWRDYEARYSHPISSIWIRSILPELDTMLRQALSDDDGHPDTRVNLSEADARWEVANDDGAVQAKGIHDALAFAQFNADDQDRWVENPDLADRILDGVAAWERLKVETGFDLEGIFRRRELIPFVLVPRQVSSKHGSAQTLSMLRNLQQAHDAFVFGASYAALALMRSIMESVLRDHYRAEGKDLSERIRNAQGRLPDGASAAALHRLRKLANAVLHLDPDKDEGLPRMDEAKLEKEIVSLLYVLRALIEGAPSTGKG